MRELGFLDFITKPIDVEHLSRAFEEVFKSEWNASSEASPGRASQSLH